MRKEPLDENAELGLAYMKEENFLEAIRYLERVMAGTSKPSAATSPDVVSAYGLCVGIVRKRWPEGVRLCRKAVEGDVLDIQLYYNLSRAYLGAGKKADAVRVLTRGLEINPRHRASRNLLARLGVRRKPLVGFLPRNHGINKVLGKMFVR